MECWIDLLKRKRGMATPYDKLAVHWEAIVRIAAIDERLKSL
ncbi:hypothetical protein [Nonomuraea sp. NPDC049684]